MLSIINIVWLYWLEPAVWVLAGQCKT